MQAAAFCKNIWIQPVNLREIEAVEIFSWLIKPKAPSKVSRREEVLQPAGQFIFFLSPLASIWQLFLLNEWLTLSMSNRKIKTVK